MTNYINDLFRTIENSAMILGMIASIVTIVVELRNCYHDKADINNAGTVYQNYGGDNRSVNVSQISVINNYNQENNCYSGIPYTASGADFNDIIWMGILLLLVLTYKKMEIVMPVLVFFCIATLIILCVLCKRSKNRGVNQTQYLIVKSVSYLLCFIGLSLVDSTLVFNLSSLDAWEESINLLFTAVGLFIIPLSLFNPFSKEAKSLWRCQKIFYSTKAIAFVLVKPCAAFFFCSGLLYEFVRYFSHSVLR